MDALDDYNSEDDDDYVPGDEADEQLYRSLGQQAAKGKGTKRKRAAATVELLAPQRLPLHVKGAKKKAATRIGAAVLSDEDDELLQPSLKEEEAAAADERKDAQHDEQKDAVPAAASDDTDGAAEEKKDGSAPHNSAAVSSPAPSSTLPSPSTATAVTSHSSAALSSPSSTPPTSTAAPAPAGKGGDLASILAQFNKKPSKPTVKKVINPWELPTKPKLTTPTNTTSTTTTTTPSTTPHPSASSTAVSTTAIAPSSAAAASALSTEQVVVSDITSYAGETIQVTKTLIRGSAEELAHRAATANNLTALLSSLTSQRSINTLEKSRLDWSVSKEEEGDADELRRFVGSKDALVDRMAFLARAEKREWEKVKGVRDESKRQTMTASTEGMDGD